MAKRVADTLREAGFQIWDDTQVLPGENWAESFGKAIDESDAMVVLLTPNSVRSSNLAYEVDYALGKQEYKGRLIPVIADPSEQIDPGEIPWVFKLKQFQMIRVPNLEGDKEDLRKIAQALKAVGPFNKSLSLSLIAVVLTFGASSSGCAYSPREPQSEVYLISPATNQTSDARQLIVNQELVASISYQSDDTTMYIPIAPIVDALGWTYVWDEETESGTIKHGETITTFTIGNTIANRNGYPILYGASKIIDGEAWLGSLAMSQILDVDYASWDSSQQKYRVLQFPNPDQHQTDLEEAAVKEVLQHLQDQSVELTRSPFELTQTPENIRTKSVQQLTDLETTNDEFVKVVVEFLTDYQPSPEDYWLFDQPGKTRYEHTYQVRFEEGQARLDLLSRRIDRTTIGSPVPFLDDSDVAKISEEWQKNNFYSLPEIVKILDNIVKKVDNGSLSSLLTRVNTQNLFYLPELDNEEVLNYFSESVINSPEWEVFLNLEGARDPGFTILSSSSTKDLISAKIIGNWTFDGVNMKPILLDIDLTLDRKIWRISCFENVHLYEDIYELADQKPRLYEKIAEQYIFRTMTRIAPFYL